MKFDQDRLTDIANGIRVAGIMPPRLVFQSFASLVGDGAVEHVLTDMKTDDGRVTWHAVALAGDLLVSLRASHEARQWHYETEKGEEREGTLEEARVISVADVAAVNVVGIQSVPRLGYESETLYEWMTNWSVTLRDGSTIHLPTSDRTYEAADAFASDLRAALCASTAVARG
ncbi:hypothetical protein GCM10027053_05430 [Intrasporangium mesophilum]